MACRGQWDLGWGACPSGLGFFITEGLGSYSQVRPEEPRFRCCRAARSGQVPSLLGLSFLTFAVEPLVPTLCGPLAHYLSASEHVFIEYPLYFTVLDVGVHQRSSQMGSLH